ncbi:hypothetical protein NXS98_15130 [Fontisphaera persica]|uniref:hypothetical protein n=1 Tax=Fontisphaera persica TaxID=2974023 RepID=UPI0024C0018E|nr:hypothetical protein [Fontisphaera persica]WCJ59034.1 hypothetical protein NXS98_15130 [Fontisphaera persica]
MNTEMSQNTRQEVLAQLRRRYARAGRLYKAQLLDQAVALLGYHRKAAIRALRAGPSARRAPGLVLGRPKTYHPETLLPVIRPIWQAAFQPCGVRLRALLPEWLAAYETDHRRLDPDLRQALLSISARTLDRLLAPLRRAGGDRPAPGPAASCVRASPCAASGPRPAPAGWAGHGGPMRRLSG